MKQKDFLRNSLFEFKVPDEVLNSAVTMLNKAEWVPNHANSITPYNSLQTHPEFTSVGRWIEKSMQEVKTELNLRCDSLAVTQIWGNKAEKGESHHVHTHMNSWLHGVIFLTHSDASVLFLADSIWAPPPGSPLLDMFRGEYTEIQDEYRTAPGKMIVFPSSLAHMVSPHGLDQPRLTLGFNAFPSGVLGDPSCLRSSSIMDLRPKSIFDRISE
jgi:hypothetical protein